MLIVLRLLARKVESDGHMDSTITGSMNALVIRLLARKVEYVGYMDSTIAESMNAHSYPTIS